MADNTELNQVFDNLTETIMTALGCSKVELPKSYDTAELFFVNPTNSHEVYAQILLGTDKTKILCIDLFEVIGEEAINESQISINFTDTDSISISGQFYSSEHHFGHTEQESRDCYDITHVICELANMPKSACRDFAIELFATLDDSEYPFQFKNLPE